MTGLGALTINGFHCPLMRTLSSSSQVLYIRDLDDTTSPLQTPGQSPLALVAIPANTGLHIVPMVVVHEEIVDDWHPLQTMCTKAQQDRAVPEIISSSARLVSAQMRPTQTKASAKNSYGHHGAWSHIQTRQNNSTDEEARCKKRKTGATVQAPTPGPGQNPRAPSPGQGPKPRALALAKSSGPETGLRVQAQAGRTRPKKHENCQHART